MFLRSSSLLAPLVMALAACTTMASAPAPSEPTVPRPTILPSVQGPQQAGADDTFANLPGWAEDDLREAWAPFLASCEVLVMNADWKEACSVARKVDARSEKAVRLFFESFFEPRRLVNKDGTTTGLVTGYYEPVLRGARKRSSAFQTPLHAAPDDLISVDLVALYPETRSLRLRGKLVGRKIIPYATRAELVQSNALAGKELVWVDDPIDAFFLQVQGSGRVYLTDTKETVRMAYADQNGHPYKSIGRYLVDKGELTLDRASAQNIKAWFKSNPARQQELLNANPSYVFFKEEKLPDPGKGPKGSLGVPLTAQRSIAIDPEFVLLGAPVFISTTYPAQEAPLRKLMLAQDTGSAIRGVVRADYFWGAGAEAGQQAGKMKQRGELWVLMPKKAH